MFVLLLFLYILWNFCWNGWKKIPTKSKKGKLFKAKSVYFAHERKKQYVLELFLRVYRFHSDKTLDFESGACSFVSVIFFRTIVLLSILTRAHTFECHSNTSIHCKIIITQPQAASFMTDHIKTRHTHTPSESTMTLFKLLTLLTLCVCNEQMLYVHSSIAHIAGKIPSTK